MADFATELLDGDWADKKAVDLVKLVRSGKFAAIVDLQRIVAHELRIAFYSGGAQASRRIANDLKPGAEVVTLQEVHDGFEH
ncbi:MAG TPA: hypothetical protein VN325_23455 [Steroidobacteraceae bacterium]|nr:hypothetical protein [Steroidobacteraceae bacterium]